MDDKKRLAEINEKILALRREQGTVSDRIFQAEIRGQMEKMLGRCFRTRNNYSCPEKPSDYWWLYRLVVSYDKGTLHTIEFERDKYGAVRIERHTHVVWPGGTTKIEDRLGTPITRRKFDTEAKKIIVGFQKQLLYVKKGGSDEG